MRKAGVDPSHPLIIEEEDRHVPSKGWENIVSFNIYREVYITFSLFKNISTFYRLFSCFLLYLTFIFSLYINFKGVSKRNPNKNRENCCNPKKEIPIKILFRQQQAEILHLVFSTFLRGGWNLDMLHLHHYLR